MVSNAKQTIFIIIKISHQIASINNPYVSITTFISISYAIIMLCMHVLEANGGWKAISVAGKQQTIDEMVVTGTIVKHRLRIIWSFRGAQRTSSSSSLSEKPLVAVQLPVELMNDLIRRVANLEYSLSELNHRQSKLVRLQTLLRMSESFKILHRQLQRYAQTNDAIVRMGEMLSQFGIDEKSLERTLAVCKERNLEAHPKEKPDLTEVDPELVTIYVKVQSFLRQLRSSDL